MGCGPANRFALGSDSRMYCKTVNVTTLDAWAAWHRGSSRLLYAKVDVEGGEWAVLQGMRGLLAAQQVDLLSFEYAVGWHAHFHKARPLSPSERGEVNATLFRFQAALFDLGYDTYLLHAPSPRHGVTLVPVYGAFWHDAFEICFNRSVMYGPEGWGRACWNDLLVVRRCSACVKRALMTVMLPATAPPGASTNASAAMLWASRWRRRLPYRTGADAFPECSCM
eukprot:5342048-Prymnesium_polylepis.1